MKALLVTVLNNGKVRKALYGLSYVLVIAAIVNWVAGRYPLEAGLVAILALGILVLLEWASMQQVQMKPIEQSEATYRSAALTRTNHKTKRLGARKSSMKRHHGEPRGRPKWGYPLSDK
jgi:hypothetical protein